jgi:hypothetical protein
MHEEEFRTRYRAAVGDAPDELGAVQRAAAVAHRAPPRPDRAGAPGAMILVAGALAVLVLAGLLGPRVLRAVPRATTPAAGGAPQGTAPAAPTLATCRLPVVVADAHSPERYTAGFVALATGQFVADPGAQAGGMPFSPVYENDQWVPQTYDPVLRRWLAANVHQVSPDHHSYLYVAQNTLRVYDVTTGQDRALWTSHDQIGFDATWESDGIHATTVPTGGGMSAYWLVDPASGAVAPAAAPPSSIARSIAAFREYGVQKGGGGDTDGQGRPIIDEGSRDPGAHYEYFVGGPNGRRIVIHAGVMGDAFDYDPNGFAADGDRLWSANYDATAIWLWTEKGGLTRYPLTGVPQHDMYVTPRVVGPCV